MNARTLLLLRCGMFAGMTYVSVGLLQILLREDFDITRHPLSILANGRFGWVQIGNFLITGSLTLAFAMGVHRALRGRFGGTFGAVMLGLHGVGLIGAGIFVAGPMAGFPPPEDRSPGFFPVNGLLHFAAGGIGFLGLILATLVFALRFARQKAWGRSMISFLTACFFTYSFLGIASGPPDATSMVTFYLGVLFSWAWVVSLSVWLMNEPLQRPL